MKKAFLFVFYLVVLHSAALGQKTPEQAALEAREQFSGIKNRSIELERMKREAEKRPENEKLPSKFPQIKEDFEQIQKLNIHLQELTLVKTPLDHSAVSRSAAEIQQRALRLTGNLFSPEIKRKKEKDANKQKASEEQDIKTLLASLDKFIDRFVHSSIFKNTNLVVAEDSLKAQKDLENIIDVSGAIKLQIKKSTDTR